MWKVSDERFLTCCWRPLSEISKERNINISGKRLFKSCPLNSGKAQSECTCLQFAEGQLDVHCLLGSTVPWAALGAAACKEQACCRPQPCCSSPQQQDAHTSARNQTHTGSEELTRKLTYPHPSTAARHCTSGTALCWPSPGTNVACSCSGPCLPLAFFPPSIFVIQIFKSAKKRSPSENPRVQLSALHFLSPLRSQ